MENEPHTIPEPLLEVRHLRMDYASGGWLARQARVVRAVDDVSFEVGEGETFGLVGESGCGKSTTARCILGLIRPTDGQVRFAGRDLLRLSARQLRPVRRELQMVVQDPFASLDPRMTIRATLLEPLEIHAIGTRAERKGRIRELLELVGLPEAALNKYPHEFSGGQRQRIGIARALALSPRLIVADEPVSALDLSIRGQVLNLMAELQRRFGLAYLFIGHDLTLIRHICRRVAVMHRGKIVEMAPTEVLFAQPLHPYTRRLLDSIPVPDPHRRSLGKKPVPFSGEDRQTVAQEEAQPLREVEAGHWARV